MFFYLTTLGLVRFLKENVPQVEPPTEGQSFNEQAVEAWKHSEFLCRNYVLNGLVDSLNNHKRKDMSVEDLVVHLRIEEDNRLAQKDTYTPDSTKANMVEHVGSSSRSSRGIATTEQPVTVLLITRCRSEVKPGITTPMVVGGLILGQPVMCGLKKANVLYSFREVDNGQKLYMGNSVIADIKSEGDVVLKMTSEKELKLTNVLYVLEIHKNLVSGTTMLIVSLEHESKILYIQKNTVMESRNASFFEHIFPCLSKETGSSARLDDEVVQDKRQRDDNDLQDKRQIKPKKKLNQEEAKARN
ncbi:hypothetical protein Tco_1353375 [Tanacetum coccineum]